MFGDIFASLSQFMEAGGQVLWFIFATTLLLWVLITERILFLRYTFPDIASEVTAVWKKRKDHSSWWALRVREMLISQNQMNLNKNVSLIKALVALCPLLGLMGTVTGMISVFDVMAITGTGNARSMASGISMATLPTMAGMVAALSGLYLGSYLEKKTSMELAKLTDSLLVK